MGRTLKIQLHNAKPELIHEFRNFGEDVYRELRNDYTISIEEMNRSTNEFCVKSIPKREVRTLAAKIQKIANAHKNLIIGIEETPSN